MEVLSARFLLHPADLERTVAWYRDVLGLRVAREFGARGKVTGVVFFLGGGFLEVSGSGGPGALPNGATLVLWLQVLDLPAEHRRLRAAGVTIDEPPVRMPWGLDEMWIRGPEGERLVLVEVPEDHPLRRRL